MRNFAKLFIVKAKDKDISSLYSNHIQNSYKIIYDMMYDIVKLSPAISKTWAELTIFSANPPSHPQKYEKLIIQQIPSKQSYSYSYQRLKNRLRP